MILVMAIGISVAAPTKSIVGGKHCGMSGAKLPYDAEVEYLGTSGTQYIDTGIVPTPNTDIDIYCAYVSSINILTIIGGGNSYNNNEILLAVVRPVNNNGIVVGKGSGSGTYMSGSTLQYVNQKHRHRISGFSYYFDDTLVATRPSATLTTSNSLYLGVAHRNSAPNMSEAFIGNYYSCMVYDNNVLVRDFISVRFTNEQGVSEGAMYDRLSGQLFRNAGTGAFIIGPDK